MNRRGFLKTLAGTAGAIIAAPAVVRADLLMRIVPVETTILSVPAWEPTTGVIGHELNSNALWPVVKQWWLGDIVTLENNKVTHAKAADKIYGVIVGRKETGEVLVKINPNEVIKIALPLNRPY